MKKGKLYTWLGVGFMAVLAATIVFGNPFNQKGSLFATPKNDPTTASMRPAANSSTPSGTKAGADAFIFVGVNDALDGTNKLLPNMYVNMYSVDKLSATEYAGTLLETRMTQANGAGASFKVRPDQIVDFVGFKDSKTALAANKWTFFTPPYKNTSRLDGVATRLCNINDLSVCQDSFIYPLTDKK